MTPATTRAAQRATLVAASLGFAVIQLDVTVVNVAVKQIGGDLGGGVAGLQWVVDAYTLLFAAPILLAGALGDRFGARRMFLTGFVVFTAASAACGAADSLALLIAARAVQGAGAALLGACSLTLITHTFRDPERRARAVGTFAAGASAALSAGPVLGGVLLATVGWRAVFFINLPIGAVGWWLTWRHTPETPRARQHRTDVTGAATAVLALGVFAAAVIESGTRGFTDAWVAAGFVAAVVLAVVFVRAESRTPDPVLPLALLRRRGIALPTLAGLAVNVVFYGLIFVFSLSWQNQHGYSPLRTGLAFLPMTVAIVGANVLTVRVSRRIGPVRTILAGLAAMAAGCVGLLGAGGATGFTAVVVQQLLLGGGLGLLVPPLTATVLGSVERSRSGVASGVLVAGRQVGSVLGVAVFGSLLSREGFATGTRVALLLSLLALTAAATAAAFTRTSNHRVQSGTSRTSGRRTARR